MCINGNVEFLMQFGAGDYFSIEERWIKRLNETMRKRRDTKEQDRSGIPFWDGAGCDFHPSVLSSMRRIEKTHTHTHFQNEDCGSAP
eukprot:4405112-Amphidinium_carterae.1